ncbi:MULTISPECIES: hypothetical protein [unclassified Microcoleus]|uniref:hypothetical protein n=1 Tax=unclassified Microcoleus TaxID=2642155 RepID=UPI0025EE4E9A|nr:MULTISPECIES: hypothetical protein [unclassified Microcoleus]
MASIQFIANFLKQQRQKPIPIIGVEIFNFRFELDNFGCFCIGCEVFVNELSADRNEKIVRSIFAIDSSVVIPTS